MPHALHLVVQSYLHHNLPSTFTQQHEGDYCRAFSDGHWIVLQAKHDHASSCLKTVQQILPALTPTLPCDVPDVQALGQKEGKNFLVYPRISGVPLLSERFDVLNASQKDALAEQLARFVLQLRSFPVDQAISAGMPVSFHPFCAEDTRFRLGDVSALLSEDLMRLEHSDVVSSAELKKLIDVRTELLKHTQDVQPVLLHTELSPPHLLLDSAQGTLQGVIDFNNMFVGHPDREFLYMYEACGAEFVQKILGHIPDSDAARVLEHLQLLHIWHTVLKLQWAIDHHWNEGIRRHQTHLKTLL